MSIVHCNTHGNIDTDFNAEHFNALEQCAEEVTINVSYINSTFPLGTTDGLTYTIVPIR